MLKEINVIAIAAGVLWTGSLSARSSGCLPVDTNAEGLKTFGKLLVEGAEERWQAAREDMDVPLADSTQVRLIQDGSICQEAVTAYNKAIGEPPDTPRSVHAVKLGPTRYIVVDPEVGAGSWGIYAVLDENFRKVYSYTG